MKIKKICALFILNIFAFTSIVFANNDETEEINLDEINQEAIQTVSNSSEEPNINSRAAVVIDRTSKKVLYGKEEKTKRKMASTTKIMTATIVIENTNLYDTVTVSKNAASTGGSRLGLKEGDKITVCDLLYGLLLKSGNDTAVALAEYVGGSVEGFADLMNNKAQQLNLTNTHFVTPHGLDDDNHYTTAYELAILADYALNNQTFLNIVGTKNYTVTINGQPKTINNTNELLGYLGGVYGVKTGFTNGANRCLVTACKRDNLDIICVVLGADTKKFRTQDSIKLIDYVFNNYQMVNLGELVSKDFELWKINSSDKITITKGKGLSRDLNLEIKDFNITLYPVKKEDVKNISTTVDCDFSHSAPIPANSKIATMNIILNKDTVLNYEIVNTLPIEKKNIFTYFTGMLTSYFEYLSYNA